MKKSLWFLPVVLLIIGSNYLWLKAEERKEISQEPLATLHFPLSSCPLPGNISQDGWQMAYAVTNSDGLEVYGASYNGRSVLTSAKVVEWHVDYGNNGFRDSPGCGNGAGGFPIPPYNDTQTLPLVENNMPVGFELVQDFRMSNWGQNCNYRYEEHYQFYADGRFRVFLLSFGRGCGTTPIYRPLIRLDLALGDDEHNFYAPFDGQSWPILNTEAYFVPYAEAGHGPHGYTPEGYTAAIFDGSGQGYWLEPSQGQFGDGGRGDNPFIFVTQHHANEGDSDMAAFPANTCCFNDYRQGPHVYLNHEATADTNLVLWLLPQAQTDAVADEDGRYCWTVTGEPTPETYPCAMGPMFVPANLVTGTLKANFSVPTTTFTVTHPITFTNLSTSTVPISFTWNFGDGRSPSHETTPLYPFSLPGTYTVTLTAQTMAGQTASVSRSVTVNGRTAYLPFVPFRTH